MQQYVQESSANDVSVVEPKAAVGPIDMPTVDSTQEAIEQWINARMAAGEDPIALLGMAKAKQKPMPSAKVILPLSDNQRLSPVDRPSPEVNFSQTELRNLQGASQAMDETRRQRKRNAEVMAYSHRVRNMPPPPAPSSSLVSLTCASFLA